MRMILDASTIESSRIEYKADWNPEKIRSNYKMSGVEGI